MNSQTPKGGTLAKCGLTISLTLQRTRYVRYYYINDFRQLHFAGCIFSSPSEIRTHTVRILSASPLPVGLPDHLPKKLPVMVPPHLQMIQSHLYYFYTNGQLKNKVLSPFLVAAIASPYLSRQVSAFRRFRQFLLPISCRLYMQAVDAGYEELPQGNYPTLLHIYVGIKM